MEVKTFKELPAEVKMIRTKVFMEGQGFHQIHYSEERQCLSKSLPGNVNPFIGLTAIYGVAFLGILMRYFMAFNMEQDDNSFS